MVGVVLHLCFASRVYCCTSTLPWSFFNTGSWISTFNTDADKYESLAVLCEAKLNDVFAMTENLPLPNALRTQVCCMLFEKLCESSFGRFKLVMNVIKNGTHVN